jgi:hypothetical protein
VSKKKKNLLPQKVYAFFNILYLVCIRTNYQNNKSGKVNKKKKND